MNGSASGKKRTTRWMKVPSGRGGGYSALALIGVGIFAGILLLTGFGAGMQATSSMEFCIGCHEMRDNVFEEYRDTIHYSNRTGVRVTCSDCHVPKDWTHKIVRKIKASRELWGTFTGSIDTREKFEAKRMELATREWKRLEKNGSAECRNCHSFDNMVARKQNPRAQKKHAFAKQEGKNCIECHKGIAHLLPAEYEDPENE